MAHSDRKETIMILVHGKEPPATPFFTPCNWSQMACLCRQPKAHSDMHRCECGGSWYYDEYGEFQIGSLPGTTSADPLSLIRSLGRMHLASQSIYGKGFEKITLNPADWILFESQLIEHFKDEAPILSPAFTHGGSRFLFDIPVALDEAMLVGTLQLRWQGVSHTFPFFSDDQKAS